jgi:dienelactone hydrolase
MVRPQIAEHRIGSVPSPRAAPPPTAAPVTAPSADGAFNGSRIEGTLSSGNRTVSYERYTPAGPGPFPAILLLHGENGLPPQSEWFDRIGKALADHGYVVEVLHYFDRTGTIAAGPGERLFNFRPWVGTVRDALGDLARSNSVDGTRVGIVGIGLGGTLALVIGAQDTRVAAVVEYGGSLPAWAAPTIHHLPPVLIAQAADDANPNAARDAERVHALCAATNAECEMDFIPKNGRDDRAHERSTFRQRTVQFLDRNLKERR